MKTTEASSNKASKKGNVLPFILYFQLYFLCYCVLTLSSICRLYLSIFCWCWLRCLLLSTPYCTRFMWGCGNKLNFLVNVIRYNQNKEIWWNDDDSFHPSSNNKNNNNKKYCRKKITKESHSTTKKYKLELTQAPTMLSSVYAAVVPTSWVFFG